MLPGSCGTQDSLHTRISQLRMSVCQGGEMLSQTGTPPRPLVQGCPGTLQTGGERHPVYDDVSS